MLERVRGSQEVNTFVVSADGKGRIDGTIKSNLLDHFPNQVSKQEDADVVLVPVSIYSDYQFNEKLNDINKPICLIDYLEYSLGWNKEHTHLLGRNHEVATNLQTDDWKRLSNWCWRNPPALYFKRELLQKDVSDRVKPIEWPCYLEVPPLQTKEEFDSRPIEVFFSWGYSNEARPRLHADIFRAMATHGIGIISEWNQFHAYFKHPEKRTWASIYAPHYCRVHINDWQWWNQRTKLSVSLPGAGQICFRHTESPVGSIMALPNDDFAWSFSWDHGDNCIRVRVGHEFEDLEEQTKRPDLFDIYLRSQETVDRYRSKRYVAEYILPAIKSVL